MNFARNPLVLLAVVMACYQPQSGRAADAADERIGGAIRTAQSRQDGDSADALNFLAEQVVAAAADPAKRAGMETLMIQGLAGAQTRAGRDFFCRQLVMIGSEAAVPALAKVLTVPESSHIARYALARIPGGGRRGMLEALGKAEDKLKVGIVNSLGARSCREAVDDRLPWWSSPNEDLAASSLGGAGPDRLRGGGRRRRQGAGPPCPPS